MNWPLLRRVIVLTALASGAVLLTAQSRSGLPPVMSGFPPQAPQAPVFRASVDLIQVDVSVLDASRRPLRGLTAADFTVLENGVEQQIVAFTERFAADPDERAARWVRTIPPDVRVNNAEDGRVLLLVLDDGLAPVFAYGLRGQKPTGPDPATAVKNAARAVIDRMGPADLASVIFTVKNKNEQEFTGDRARLLAAIDGFSIENSMGGGDYAASTLKDAAKVLATVSSRRKALIYISGGSAGVQALNTPFIQHASAYMQESLKWALRSNITVYHINPYQMTDLDPRLAQPRADSSPAVFRPPPDREVDPVNRGTTLMAATGGFSIRQPGELTSGIAQIFQEIGSDYLLGYVRPNRPYDDKTRRIDVKVGRAGATLHARSGYLDEKPVAATKPALSSLATAITGLLPASDIAMRVNIAPFAIPGKDEAALAIVVGLRQPVPVGSSGLIRETVLRLTRAFTPSGKSKGKPVSEVIELELRPGNTEVKYELLTRLDLEPGRYHLRLSATSRAFGKSGSVYDDIEIPDFWKAPVSLSGVVLSTTPPLPSGPKTALARFLPVTPTTQREFMGHSGSAFLRVYQGGRSPLATVTLTIRITDERDALVVTSTETLDAARFGSAKERTADYRFPLPVDRLPPGSYLLEFEATLGRAIARRVVRFSVI